MSVNTNFYVIAGYDLTGLDTDEFEKWKYEDGEKYMCNHSKGEIQFFDDPICGTYLYFGYILASFDMDEDNDSSKIEDITIQRPKVECELIKLQELGVIKKDIKCMPKYEIIAFVEYS